MRKWPKTGILNNFGPQNGSKHYDDVIMDALTSLITSLTIVYSTVYSDADQRNYQSFVSLAFVWGLPRGPVNSPHKWPVTRKMFPFQDVIMNWASEAPIVHNSNKSSYDEHMKQYLCEWVIIFNGLSQTVRGQQGPCSPYKPCNHRLDIGINISLMSYLVGQRSKALTSSVLPHCPWYFSFFTIFHRTNSCLISSWMYTPLIWSSIYQTCNK